MARPGLAEFHIEGLGQFRRALRDMGATLPHSLREYNVKAAKRIVDEARDNATKPQEQKAAKSLRASRSGSQVAVMLGDSKRYAFALGAEFGARRYNQFRAWRGNQWKHWEGGPGYFLHPAIRDVGHDVLDEYWQSIRRLHQQAFPD